MPRLAQRAVIRAGQPARRGAASLIPNEAVRVSCHVELERELGVRLVEALERAHDVRLADVPVRSLRAGDEVALHTERLGSVLEASVHSRG